MSLVMKLEEIRGKDSRELRLDRQALQQELFKLRFRGESEDVAHSSHFRDLRRTIARVYTVLRERELAAADKSAESDVPKAQI